MVLLPFLAAIFAASGLVFDKIILSRQKVNWRNFEVGIFLFLFLITLVLVPILGYVSSFAWTKFYLSIFAAEIFVAVIYNIYLYRGVQHENVNEFELIIMLTPLMTILLAGAFFESERNFHIFIAGIIAALALIYAHLQRKHFEFNQYSVGLLLYTILASAEALLVKELVQVWSPVALYAARCFFIFLIFLIFLQPPLKQLSKKNWLSIFGVSFLGVGQMVLSFYGYRDLGIVYTTLVLILVPILVFAASYFIFKEPVKKRIIVSAMIILACIIYATLIR